MTTILGIESSCDETSASVVIDGKEVLATTIASQIEMHKKFGGVVPELAARAHIENIIPIIMSAMEKASVTKDQIDAIAVANCPGLSPALLIGVTAAKTLSWSWNIPLIDVNHVHCHLQSVMLDGETNCFPSVALVVSGGHTSIYDCKEPLSLNLIGKTIDDAAGEAFDKVAMILKEPYPGGPSIEKLARDGNPKTIRFPRSMLNKESLDFSFSGLKTAVLYHCCGQDMQGASRVDKMSHQEKADIAASFQAAVIDVLVKKTLIATRRLKAKTVLLGGGVAANSALRNDLEAACSNEGIRLVIASRKYCTDNAAMVAGSAYYKYKAGMFADLTLEARASGR